MVIVIGGAILVLRINTRRIKAEEALKHLEEERRLHQEIERSEKRYRELVEQAYEGICMVDKDDVTVFANRRMCEITGYDDLSGKPASLFLNEESQKKIAVENKKRRRGESSRYEVELTTRDRRQIPVIISGSPRFDEQGNFLGTFGIFTDISERKKNEEELKRINEELKKSEAALLNVLSDFHEANRKLKETSRELENIFESVTEYSIMTVDLEGKVIFFGKGSQNVFGWSPEELLGKNITMLHKKEKAEDLIPELLKEAKQEGKSEREIECIRKNGELFPAILTVTPIDRKSVV